MPFSRFAATSVLGVIAFCVTPVVEATHYDVVLMGGQSNMLGRATSTGLSGPLANPQSDVAFYYNSSQPPTNTADQSTWTTLRPGSGTDIGPELSFGRTVADAQQSQNFALIKHATGGTSLGFNWAAPNGGEYVAFRNTVQTGLNALTGAGHTYTITGMLWNQGESDAAAILNSVPANQITSNYQTNLNNFIADVRSRYGEDLPFFISRLSAEQASGWAGGVVEDGVNAIRTAQENVASADANAYLVDADGFGLKSDNLHFNQAGQIDLGEAFAASYLSAVPEPSTLALLGLGGLCMLRRRREIGQRAL